MRLCWMPLLLLVAGTTFAQSLPLQPCPTDALDATFEALEGPDHSYSLALNIRNITGEACSIAAYPGGTGMALDPDSSGTWVKICYHCEENGRGPSDARITLAPGEYAHQTRSWNTLPGQPASKCVSMTEMSWDGSFESNSRFWLFSPSLLKPICSQLSTTDYAAGEFLLDSVASLEPGLREPLILWANDQSIDYTREHIPLRVTVEDRGHLLILDKRSCPQPLCACVTQLPVVAHFLVPRESTKFRTPSAEWKVRARLRATLWTLTSATSSGKKTMRIKVSTH